jgi:transcriptional regulator with XRE-family HTH domain
MEKVEVNYTKLKSLGKRLRKLRELGKITQKQIEFVTKMDQSHLSRLEAGEVNVSINYIFLIADFYGLEDYEILNYNGPLPERGRIEKNVTKFLKKNNLSATDYFKDSLSSILKDKILTSKFLTSPKYTKEIAQQILVNYKEKFSTSAISQALDVLIKKGLVEKIKTDKKSKFQYKKK